MVQKTKINLIIIRLLLLIYNLLFEKNKYKSSGNLALTSEQIHNRSEKASTDFDSLNEKLGQLNDDGANAEIIDAFETAITLAQQARDVTSSASDAFDAAQNARIEWYTKYKFL